MTIRRILLLAFLLVSLVPASLLTLLAFENTRAAMLGEIEQGVRRSATSVSADVDRLLFERLLNATTWNHLEVMQDLRLDDVDKRLSIFLAEMKRRYGGVYRDLHAITPQGHIVASSNPLRLRQTLPAGKRWLTADLPGDVVHIDLPATDADGEVSLNVRSPILSQFTDGSLGDLVLEVDWGQVERVLDLASTPTRQVLVLDAKGHIVAASQELRERGLAAGADFADWLPAGNADSGVEMRDATALIDARAIVGYDRARGFERFSGFGWTYLLLQSSSEALAPVQRMGWIFAGLLATLAILVVLASLAVAGQIARPVVALTEFTRRYMQPGETPPVPRQGPGEIGELNRSFVRMMNDLQRSQQTLTQASKLAALGEVTALLAHEVRTPLGILRSSAQMLRSEPALSAEGAALLQIIDSETQRLNRLVSSMLDSARTRLPQRAPTEIHGLIAHAASLLAAQARDRGIALHLSPAATDSTVDCDAEQITQVLLNLIMNALQVLPRGGRVDVATAIDGARLVVEVSDNGPGIPPEERASVFEPFVFKREGGIGLGLAVVRQIVRQHGGDVVADAGPRGGALFRLWLPRKAMESS